MQRYFAELLANVRLLSGTETVTDAMESLAEAFEDLEPEPTDATSLDTFYCDEFGSRIRPLLPDADIDPSSRETLAPATTRV